MGGATDSDAVQPAPPAGTRMPPSFIAVLAFIPSPPAWHTPLMAQRFDVTDKLQLVLGARYTPSDVSLGPTAALVYNVSRAAVMHPWVAPLRSSRCERHPSKHLLRHLRLMVAANSCIAARHLKHHLSMCRARCMAPHRPCTPQHALCRPLSAV